jgi:hypothetical protein
LTIIYADLDDEKKIEKIGKQLELCTPEADGETFEECAALFNANPNGINYVAPHINMCCITMIFNNIL